MFFLNNHTFSANYIVSAIKTYMGLLKNREKTTDGCQNYNRRSIDGF